MSWYEAYLWSVVGNLLPVPFLLWGLEPASRALLAFPNPAGRFLRWRTQRVLQGSGGWVQRWGVWGLLPFVAVPLPLTGAWSGSLIAWAVGMRRGPALAAIAAGVLMAGGIVTGLVQAGAHFPFVGR